MVGAIQDAATRSPDQPFVISGGNEITYSNMLHMAADWAERWRNRKGMNWAFSFHDTTAQIVSMMAASSLGKIACLLNPGTDPEEFNRLCARFEFDLIIADRPGYAIGDTSVLTDDLNMLGTAFRVTISQRKHRASKPKNASSASEMEQFHGMLILTTGTTGPSKGALYKWHDLFAQVRRDPRLTGSRWLLTYGLNHFAGYQVLAHAIMNRGTVVVPRTHEFTDLVEAISTHGTDYISGTPTFWRMFSGQMIRESISLGSLRHITIGGEPVTEDLLSRLQELFPRVPISQVYATTEVGSCFSVRDGKPGFPKSYLQGGNARVALKIINDALYVRTSHGMRRYWSDSTLGQGSWVATGDLVEIRGDRVLFRGRASETINVGGYKVYPGVLEEMVQNTRGVGAARVYGIHNPVSGQVVAVDVVLDGSVDEDSIVSAIRERYRKSFDRYHQPRKIRVVEELQMINQKIVRDSGEF